MHYANVQNMIMSFSFDNGTSMRDSPHPWKLGFHQKLQSAQKEREIESIYNYIAAYSLITN